MEEKLYLGFNTFGAKKLKKCYAYEFSFRHLKKYNPTA